LNDKFDAALAREEERVNKAIHVLLNGDRDWVVRENGE